MKKIFLIMMGFVVTLALVGCDTAGKFTPSYNEADHVELTAQEKQALISEINFETSLEEVVQLSMGGEFKLDAKMDEQKVVMNAKVKGNIFVKDADDIKDFVLYAEISSLTFSTTVSGSENQSENTSIKLDVTKSFILVKEGDLYFNIDLSYAFGGNRIEIKESGKVVDGFKESFEAMKSNVAAPGFDDILPNIPNVPEMSFSDFEVYQNDKKMTLVHEISFKAIFEFMFGSMYMIETDIAAELENIKLKSVVEIKENKVTGFSSYVNGTIKNLKIAQGSSEIVLNAQAKNLGIGANMNSKLPKLPNVSNYKVVASLPELPSLS